MAILFPFVTPTGQAICDLEFKRKDAADVVIVTERHDNPGMSINNGFEFLFPQVVQFWELSLAMPPIWVEHWLLNDEDDYHLVTYSLKDGRAINPKWSFLSQLDFDVLVGL